MSISRKHLWIIRTIMKAGKISRADMSTLWKNDRNLGDGRELSRQRLIAWLKDIRESLGIDIRFEPGAKPKYYIKNPRALRDEVTAWLLDIYDTAEILSDNFGLRDRIVVDEVPSSHEFFEPIVQAMKEKHTVLLTYRGFSKEHSHTFPVEPYCLRRFARRWYMLGHSLNDDRMRLYALDRIEDVEETPDTFCLPEDFHAKEYFASFFGVTLDDKVEVQRVVLRADSTHKYYLRSLPIHPSQHEVPGSDKGDTADFELRLRPGFEFCLELLHAGTMIEVLEPQSLRDTLRRMATEVADIYKRVPAAESAESDRR